MTAPPIQRGFTRVMARSYASAWSLRELPRGVAGQAVGALILGMAGMALDPVPFELVRRGRLDQFLPQLGIPARNCCPPSLCEGYQRLVTFRTASDIVFRTCDASKE